MVVSVDEEGHWNEGDPRAVGFRKMLDASSMVITPEPTSLNIVRAHRGLCGTKLLHMENHLTADMRNVESIPIMRWQKSSAN